MMDFILMEMDGLIFLCHGLLIATMIIMAISKQLEDSIREYNCILNFQ